MSSPTGNARAVSVVGGFAYVADGSGGLRVIDISNPAMPVEVGFFVGSGDTPHFAVDVSVVGGLAYVADEFFGIRVYDVSNPYQHVYKGFFRTPGRAKGVSVVGGLAYVAEDLFGVRILDVSRIRSFPEALEVGYVNTSGNAVGVSVVGDLIYVADTGSGLSVIKAVVPVPEPVACLLQLAAIGAVLLIRRGAQLSR